MKIISAAAIVLLATASIPAVVIAQTTTAATAEAAFTLPPLPYAVDALSPAIDAETMTIHHGKHHKAYVETLNKAVSEAPALKGKSLSDLLAAAGTLSPTVRNNAGGHWNHSFFWQSLTPASQSGKPSDALTKAIAAQYGSLDAFKAEFKKAGTGRFGSGWVWLIVGKDGKLAITSTPNQDNQLMDVADVKGTPILGIDMWEHAYYLKYQNKRADYIDAFWQVVNWNAVSERYAEATPK